MEKATLPTGVDALLIVLLQASGLPSAATIKRTQFLSGVFSAGGVEATFTNYTRPAVTAGNITIVVNTTTDVVSLDTSDQVWSAAGGATNNSLAKLILCYRPTSSTADSAVPILSAHDFVASTTGGNLTATIPAIGTAT